MRSVRKLAIVGTLLLAFIATGSARAEILEEIIAWVNGEIITKSEYEDEEKAMLAELYRRYSGTELDAEVIRARTQLLQRMIDNKILIHHGSALGLDMDMMGQTFLTSFKEQQKIETDEEFDRLLAQEGMTRREIRNKLMEMYAPEQVIYFEVGQRIAVGDREVEEYYQANPDAFEVEGQVTLSEIVLLADTDARKLERRPKADELRQQVLAGEDFAELAKQWSEAGTRENGGVLGPLPKSDLSALLAEKGFSLPVGEVSEVMETPYGFHIIRVDSREDDHIRSLEEIREQLRTALEDRKYQADLEKFLDKARRESEWCVKAKHQGLLSKPAPTTCGNL